MNFSAGKGKVRYRSRFYFCPLLLSLCVSRLHAKTTAVSAIREARHLKVVTLIMNELELMQFIIYITVYHGSLASSNLRKDATYCRNRQFKARRISARGRWSHTVLVFIRSSAD